MRSGLVVVLDVSVVTHVPFRQSSGVEIRVEAEIDPPVSVPVIATHPPIVALPVVERFPPMIPFPIIPSVPPEIFPAVVRLPAVSPREIFEFPFTSRV
jgi:hypothetical protein